MNRFKTATLLILFLTTYLMIPRSTEAESRVSIARWFNNRQAAVSLRFDDTLESHVKIAVPILNKHDFKATFMVNPGSKRYRKYEKFWSSKLPAMGHHLGNHTMNHKGAKNIPDAEYEIGEASRRIWDIQKNRSKLLVFASGGGETWGGKPWEEANISYKKLVEKYHLIDLYDGKHAAVSADSKNQVEDLIQLTESAIDRGSHQPFLFHGIGKQTFKDIIFSLVYKYNLSYSIEDFKRFLDFIDSRRNILWVAPLVEVLKYETEYLNTSIELISESPSHKKFKLSVGTDPAYYDHPLTLVISIPDLHEGISIFHNSVPVTDHSISSGILLVNVSPVSGDIYIKY